MKPKEIRRAFEVIRFNNLHHFHWDDRFVFKGESHNSWEVVFVLDGCVRCTEDGRTYLVQAGEILFHAPMEFHTIRSMEGVCPTLTVMTFCTVGDVPRGIMNGVFSLTEEEIAAYTAICSAIDDFFGPCTSVSEGGQEIADALSVFLIRLSRKSARAQPGESARARDFRIVVTEMTRHVTENLTLADFARLTNMSVSYMKILFNIYSQMSPKRYYIRLRALESARLLSSGKSVTDVAEEMGFPGIAYFSVFFKRFFGCPPSEYPQKHAAQDTMSFT